MCDGRIKLSELNKRLSLSLPAEDFDTLSGFVFDLFGKIPEVNEAVVYKQILEFIVQRMEGRKIAAVKLILKNDENKIRLFKSRPRVD